MHRKDCRRHNPAWFYGEKKIPCWQKTKEKKVESTEGCHVRGRAPFSKTFLIYISCAFCLGLMCWASAWDVSFIFFSPSSSCCNRFKSLVSYISLPPNGAINRLHPHIHYRKRCHSAISSAVSSQSLSTGGIILVMDYKWSTLKLAVLMECRQAIKQVHPDHVRIHNISLKDATKVGNSLFAHQPQWWFNAQFYQPFDCPFKCIRWSCK